MDYTDYIKTELLILVPVLYVIGIGLKKSRTADKNIPVILGTIAIILSTLWIFATESLNGAREILSALFTAITQGVLSAGASVYISQLYIQSKKDE